MGNGGQISGTYVAALQHDLTDIPDGATLVGVARQPTRWFSSTMDENLPALGPPEDALDALEREREDLKIQGMCDEGAHNAAWENLGFEQRYREHLVESSAAQAALDDLRTRLADGEVIVLVSFENPQKKRCHRTILLEQLDGRR